MNRILVFFLVAGLLFLIDSYVWQAVRADEKPTFALNQYCISI